MSSQPPPPPPRDDGKIYWSRTVSPEAAPTPDRNNYYLVEFIPFDEPKDDMYGLFCIHSGFITDEECKAYEYAHIRRRNKYAKLFPVPKGVFAVLTRSEKYAEKVVEVEQEGINEEKENEIFRQHHRQTEEEREKERKEAEDIKRRQKELLDDAKKPYSTDDLEYYIRQKVKRANLLMFIQQADERLAEAQAGLEKTAQEIKRLNEEHPEYLFQYRKQYDEAKREAGIDDDGPGIFGILDKDEDEQLLELHRSEKRKAKRNKKVAKKPDIVVTKEEGGKEDAVVEDDTREGG